jgi:gas vesicle protein
MEPVETRNSTGLWKGVLAGGVIGAAAALLLAPRAGKDTRQRIGDDLRKWKDRSGELASAAQEKAIQWKDAVKETGRERLQQTKEAAGNAVETIKESVGDLKDSASQAFGSLKQEADDAAKSVKSAISSAADTVKLNQSDNSSLAQNEEEIKKLGKEMDQMKTGTELQKEGLVPDPVQK